MQSDAATVDDYLAELPEDRREAIATVRRAVVEHLPEGYEEGMYFGMIGWYVPLERYPGTYNGQPLALASLANQKRHMALYLNCVYADGGEASRFHERWGESGKKLDMGKSCVRFRKLDDVPLDVVAEVIENTPVDEMITRYERSRR